MIVCVQAPSDQQQLVPLNNDLIHIQIIQNILDKLLVLPSHYFWTDNLNTREYNVQF